MNSSLGERSAFSILEFVVVMAIITLVIAILLPAVGRVRAAARSTVCLSNLRQWGQAYQMYLSSNRVKAIPEQSNEGVRWWEALAPYNGNVQATLICPDAAESSDAPATNGVHTVGHNGTASTPWRRLTYEVREPKWLLRGDYHGSYGFNVWVYKHDFPNLTDLYHRTPVREPTRVPLLGDCCSAWAVPLPHDPVPHNLYFPREGFAGGVGGYCIDRHQMGVNVVFLDGHAEHEPLDRR